LLYQSVAALVASTQYLPNVQEECSLAIEALVGAIEKRFVGSELGLQ